MFNITTHLEINMLTPDVDYKAVSTFAIKYRCPAVVIAPEFAPMMITDKSTKRGTYKLVAAIDFPNGKNYAMDKFRSINPMTLRVDGVDVLLTKDKTQIESSNEIKAVCEMLKKINPLIEFRYTLGCHTKSEEQIKNLIKAFGQNQPSIIRTDQHLALPNVGIEEHTKEIGIIKSLIGRPIKVSGNIDLNTINALLKIDNRLLFDVTLQQAFHITNEMTKAARAPKSSTEENNNAL